MLWLSTVSFAALWLMGKGGSISEPFLLALIGGVLILTGDVIRQRDTGKRTSHVARNSPEAQTKAFATNLVRPRSKPTLSNYRRSVLIDSEVDNSLSSSQLWLPLNTTRESSEGSAEVMHR
jgi:hypothetical protein